MLVIPGYSYCQPCQVDDCIAENYLFDARILSLRDMLADEQHPCHDSVVIPKELVTDYLQKISSVYSLHSDASDSVFNKYEIHVFPDVPYAGIHMLIDTNYAWISNYLRDSLVSGNTVFDSLAARYNFRLQSYYHFSSSSMMTIATDGVYNVSALLETYRSLEGILSVGPEMWAGDGNDIRSTISGDKTLLLFSYGWMDCPAGCIYRHGWEFSVSGCEAGFDRSFGSPFSLAEARGNEELVIFPNPCTDKLYIPNPSAERLRILLYSMAGERILETVSFSGFIDMTGIEAGVYLLCLERNGVRSSHKILKY